MSLFRNHKTKSMPGSMDESTEVSQGCIVCSGQVIVASESQVILQKYSTRLNACSYCGHEWFENPNNWLADAYSSPIANTDTGIVARSLYLNRIVSSFLGITGRSGKILDWGSGSGLLVRLLRDDGHDCYGFEPYTLPVLAAGHTIKDENSALAGNSYRAIVAIEVIEHLGDPINFFEKVLAHTDTLIFSTELVDKAKNGSDWWYYSRDTGQHISFYTEKSLAHLAGLNGSAFGSAESKSLHIFTRRPSDMRFFKLIAATRRSWLAYLIAKALSKLSGRYSLMMSDHLAAKKA